MIKVGVVALFFVVANFAVEIMAPGNMDGFNVLDTHDAIYGAMACVVVVIVYLFSSQRSKTA